MRLISGKSEKQPESINSRIFTLLYEFSSSITRHKEAKLTSEQIKGVDKMLSAFETYCTETQEERLKVVKGDDINEHLSAAVKGFLFAIEPEFSAERYKDVKDWLGALLYFVRSKTSYSSAQDKEQKPETPKALGKVGFVTECGKAWISSSKNKNVLQYTISHRAKVVAKFVEFLGKHKENDNETITKNDTELFENYLVYLKVNQAGITQTLNTLYTFVRFCTDAGLIDTMPMEKRSAKVRGQKPKKRHPLTPLGAIKKKIVDQDGKDAGFITIAEPSNFLESCDSVTIKRNKEKGTVAIVAKKGVNVFYCEGETMDKAVEGLKKCEAAFQ
jgi:hypothetical protein